MEFEGKKVFIAGHGYPSIRLDGETKNLHVLVWERVHGPCPKGMHIHHRDENKMNYELSNLLLLTPVDHRRIHSGWVRENGIWVAKPCNKCKKILPLDNFSLRKSADKKGQYISNCKTCSVVTVMERRNKNKIYFPEKEEERKRKRREWTLKKYGPPQSRRKEFCKRGHRLDETARCWKDAGGRTYRECLACREITRKKKVNVD